MAALLLSTGMAAAAILTVDDDAAADFTSIQSAINASGFGDVVSVMPGTYNELITVTTDGISIVGSGMDLSVISGSGLNTGSTLVRISGVTNATVFEGFTIAGKNHEGDGGGVVIENGGVTFRNNKVLENAAEFGGGLFVTNSDAVIEANLFDTNLGTRGSGIYITGGDPMMPPVIRNNAFHNNGGSQLGGGIFVQDSPVEITANTINSNRASNNQFPPVRGGGIYVECTDGLSPVPVIANNSITSNGFGTATGGEGPAAYVETDCLSGLVFFGHNNVWNNLVNGDLGAPQLAGLLDDTILNSLSYTNQNLNPQYVSGSARDFHLRSNSPIKDKGFVFPDSGCMDVFCDDFVSLKFPAFTDFEGTLRPQSGTVPSAVRFFRAHPLSYDDPAFLGTFNWNMVNGAGENPGYNIYRGLISQISPNFYGFCQPEGEGSTAFDQRYDEIEDPPIGDAFFYVVTGENIGTCQLDIGVHELNGESPFGNDTDGNPRPNLNPCQTTCDMYF